MLEGGIVYKSLLQSLSLLGPSNAEIIVRVLKEQGIIRDGQVDTDELWKSLSEMFGDASCVLCAGMARPSAVLPRP